MIRLGTKFMIGAAVLLGSTTLISTEASAQASRTWVSGVGDDANPCSRTAPCKTFAGAISKTAAGGEMNCLDPGGWGSVTITKSMTIDCSTFPGSILNAGVPAITVNDSGAGTVIVVIRGLELNASSNASPGLVGIRFVSGASLTLENVVIRGNALPSNSFGVQFSPSTPAKLNIRNTTITNNGNATSADGGGILIAPSGTASVDATIENSTISGNGNAGILVAPTATSGFSRVQVLHSTVSNNNGSGVSAVATTAARPQILIKDSAINSNTGAAISASNPQAKIWASNNSITSNGYGIQLLTGGIVQTYGDNVLYGNTATDTPTAAPAKI